jgi:hypothetical protein
MTVSSCPLPFPPTIALCYSTKMVLAIQKQIIDNRSEIMDTKTSAQYFSMTHDGDFFHYLSTLFPSTENSEPSDDLEHAIQLEFSPQEYALGLSATELDTEHTDVMEDFLMTDLERALSFPETYDMDYKDEGTLDADDYFDIYALLLSPETPDQIQKTSLYIPLERKGQSGTERNDSNDVNDRSFQIQRTLLYSPIGGEQSQNDAYKDTSMQELSDHKQPRHIKKRSIKEPALSSPTVSVPLLPSFYTPTRLQPIAVVINALGIPSVELPLSAASTSFYSPALLQPIAMTPKQVELNSVEIDGRLPLIPASARLNTYGPAMAAKRGLGKEQDNKPSHKKQRKAY